MAVYSYARTSEVEATEVGTQLEELLEKESLRLHTYALRVGIRVNQNIVEQGLLWSVELADRPAWQNLLTKLENGDIIITCTMERMFSSCEDIHFLLRMRRIKKIANLPSGELLAH